MSSYQRPIATMGLSRTVFEIDGDFSRKSVNFRTPCIFAPAEELGSLGIGYRALGPEN